MTTLLDAVSEVLREWFTTVNVRRFVFVVLPVIVLLIFGTVGFYYASISSGSSSDIVAVVGGMVFLSGFAWFVFALRVLSKWTPE